MLNKIFLYSLPVVLTLSFAACGSSSKESATQEEQLLTSGYPVVVERGPVLDANVTDSNGSVAIQVSDSNNTYIFESEPEYPIHAVGGWIDVDGDGNLTEADIALDINLTSYTSNITPTTTYCADENETIRKQRAEELAAETNTTVEDLLELPSKATRNSIIVLNTVYEKLIQKENTNAAITLQAIMDRFIEIGNNANFDENATSKEIAREVEKDTVIYLVANGEIKKLEFDDIAELIAKKPKKIKAEDEEDDEDSDDSEDSDSSEDSDDSEDSDSSDGSTITNTQDNNSTL